MNLAFSFSLTLFWLGIIVAVIMTATILLIAKFGLKRHKFRTADLKAAGLNHQQRREWRAAFRRKHRTHKRRR